MSMLLQAPRTFYARTQRAVLRLVADWIGFVGGEPGTCEIETVTLRQGQARPHMLTCWEAEVTWRSKEGES